MNEDNSMDEMLKNNQDVIKLVALDYLSDRKRNRRWKIFYRSIFILIILLLLKNIYFNGDVSADLATEPHIALIDIKGEIFDSTDTNADKIAEAMHAAYADQGTKAVLLRINSPGGSPVQADYIYHEIMRYRNKFPKVKVYAVCTDVCASAAYYIASAANDIYASPSSLVGSIGVLYNGFGFTGVMQKVGIERRLITAGSNKGFLDPFLPVNQQQKKHLENMLKKVHHQFENSVIKGRGKRLKIDKDIFSGLFWTGDIAKDKGLIDGFGSPGSVSRDVIKIKKVKDYTVSSSYLEKISKQFGKSISSELLIQLGFKEKYITVKIILEI